MPTVKDLILERFAELTEIQKLAIPRVLAGENVLIFAPTGSGKSESALLPILEHIKSGDGGLETGNGICALYITPLRALSRDLQKRFNWWCDRLDISHDVRTGDTTQSQRSKHRKTPPKILLTTIESLQALLMGRVMRQHLANVKYVIVDELHDVLDNKRGAQLSMGLERLNLIANFQRVGMSATVANESEAAKLLFGSRMYAVCETGKNRKMEISVERIEKKEKKLERIKELSEKNRTLIFVNTRSTAEELSASLKKAEAPVDVHHGSLAKEVRTDAEDRFKTGSLQSLLSTSSLELGIDIGDIDLVVQNGSPHQVFRLIQRVGRSGHSLEGIPRGIVLADDLDDEYEAQVINVMAQNGRIEGKLVERGALDVIGHQLVGLCLDLGRIDLKRAHEILSASYAYGLSYERLRKVALALYSEALIYFDERPDGSISIKIKPRAREYYYSNLSTIPKEKRYLLKDVTRGRIIASLDERFVSNLDISSSFLSKGSPWMVLDITDNEVIAQPSSAADIAIPDWTGEDIPVPYEVAQGVGKMRAALKKVDPLPDEKTIVIEMIQDLLIVHACFGTKVNEVLSRLFSKNLSKIMGESVRAVADPYRILIKLPFALKEEHILKAFNDISNVRSSLEESLSNSYLLRFKFLHVGRLFGLLAEDARVSNRFIEAMRYSAVYEETVRSIFFRYFDVKKTEDLLECIKKKEVSVVVDKRDKPSFFANLGLKRFSAKESIGGFEPREQIVAGFREQALSKTLQLKCMNCKATRYLHLAGAPETLLCHKCGNNSYTLLGHESESSDEQKFKAGLIRAYGKKALIALSTYGIGARTADRILRKLHKDEAGFILDLLEAQKNFVKNKKFWKPG
jgi:ATP-dependent Lhr-like helicase